MFGCCRRFISSYEFSRRKVPCQNLSFIFESFLSALPCTLHLFGDIGENTRLHFAFVHFAVQNTQFRSYKSNEVARHTHSRCEKNYLLGSFYKNTLVSLVYFDKFSSFNSAHKIMNLSRVHVLDVVQRKQRTQKRRRIRRAHCSWQSDRKHLTWIILFREYSFQLRPSHMLASASVLFKLRRAPAAIAKKKQRNETNHFWRVDCQRNEYMVAVNESTQCKRSTMKIFILQFLQSRACFDFKRIELVETSGNTVRYMPQSSNKRFYTQTY